MASTLSRPRYVDGLLDTATCSTLDSLKFSPEYGAVLPATMIVDVRDALIRALINDTLHGAPNTLAVMVRSGICRIGGDMDLARPLDEIVVNENGIRFPVDIRSYHNSTQFFDGLTNAAKEKGARINLGGIMVIPEHAALGKEEVQWAMENQQLWLPPETTFNADGSVDVPLAPVQYEISNPNFTSDRVARVLSEGKHALRGLQYESKNPLTKKIPPKGFFVGAINIALGPYYAILEPQSIVNGTESNAVHHLAARFIHGVRTTGSATPRQLELYNKGNDPVSLDSIRIRIRFYPADEQTTAIAERVINMRTLIQGVHVDDLMNFHQSQREIDSLMANMSSIQCTHKAFGMLVGGGRAAYVDWQETASAQYANLLSTVMPEFLADGECLRGNQIPHAARNLSSNVLGFVGGDQSTGKVFVSHAFPPPSVAQELLRHEIGVFMAHDLQPREDAHSKDAFLNGAAVNRLVFTGTLYEEFRALERNGALLYAVMHSEVDALRGEKAIPQHVRRFYRGLFTRPSDIPRMEKIDTIIAFYGSNVFGCADEQLLEFMRSMKELRGEHFAITHGRGPGLMFSADKAAEAEGVFRIGVGIDARKKGQQMNPGPEAMAIFSDNDRLPRQRLMDDLAQVKIFSIGAAGTLEEAAITLCSQKLLKTIPAPIIFVDAVGLNGGSCTNMWSKLKEQIDILAMEHHIHDAAAENGVRTVRLMQQYLPNTIHLVRSYSEAFAIVQDYMQHPLEYYRRAGIPAQQLQLAFESARRNFETTGFPWPQYIPQELPDILASEERL